MTLRALVLEDEWATRSYLVELLQASGGIEVAFAVASAEDARQVLDAPAAGSLDVAFVNVRLAGSEVDDEGLALVRAHAPRPDAPMFVLATALRQHALEAYDLGVVDYLLKPFTQARVDASLERVRQRRPPKAVSPASPASPVRVVARRKRALVFLRLDEVWGFEAAERMAYVHSARGRLEVDLTLSAVEASFGRTLLRVHRNWLVNAAHVKELEGTGSETELLVGPGTTADGGLRVPVARERAQSVRAALMENAMGVRAR